MPNIKSAIKRVRVTKAKNNQNRIKKSALKTSLRSIREAMQTPDATTAALLQDTIKKVDQAVAKNLLHKNTAARKKSQLMKAFSASKPTE
jgi:small subunit ribosomal protein S20